MADIKVISATLLSGHNTVQVTDPMISDGSIFEIYVSDPNIICNNIVVGGTTANITFDSKPTTNTNVKILLNNLDGVLKVASIDVTDGTTTQSAINTSVSNSISTLTSGKADLSTLNDRVPSETVLGGVLYHGTTGNVWKKLTGANVDYDENNTVNQKIDACFQSVSSGKSLIASAITDKGVETSPTDTFQTMATNIENISTGVSLDCIYASSTTRGSQSNFVINKILYKSDTFSITSLNGYDCLITVNKNCTVNCEFMSHYNANSSWNSVRLYKYANGTATVLLDEDNYYYPTTHIKNNISLNSGNSLYIRAVESGVYQILQYVKVEVV